MINFFKRLFGIDYQIPHYPYDAAGDHDLQKAAALRLLQLREAERQRMREKFLHVPDYRSLNANRSSNEDENIAVMNLMMTAAILSSDD